MALPKPTVAQARGVTARQQAILRVVREEIAANGFDNVTMNALAAKAGVVKKTLYNLYGGKDDLLLAAVTELVEMYLLQPAGVAEGFPSIIASRRASMQLVQQNPRYATTMLQSLLRVDDNHQLTKLLLHDSVSYVATHLQIEATAGHLLPSVDVQQLARSIVAQGYGSVTLLAKNMVQTNEILATSLHELLALLASVARGDLRNSIDQELQALLTQHNKPLRAVAQQPLQET